MSGSLPISEILKKGNHHLNDNDQEPQPKRSRQEEYKKAKELEEARKAGDAPAAVDEDGRDINPHIPQYISSVPFFYNTNQPTLRHQRELDQKKKHVPLELPFRRGMKIQTATKYRPGACENCGAMTHKKKDCLERPRKVGAKYSNKDIAPDEVIMPEIDHSFDSKRDRWAGFEAQMYNQTIEEYNKVEEAKRKLKEEKLKQEAQEADNNVDKAGPSSYTGDVPLNDSGDDDDYYDDDNTNKRKGDEEDDEDLDNDDEDEEKYADHADMPGTKVDSKQRITIRNLRLREDTAKYLLNLDPHSAYYDPKTRSMREDPLLNTDKAAETGTTFKGENFVRYTGAVQEVNKAQVFAWQAAEKGVDIHLQALPTKTEIVHKEFEISKKKLNERMTELITKMYGKPDDQAKPVSELRLGQSEQYIEYSRAGELVQARSLANTSSINNHEDDGDQNGSYELIS